MAGVNCELLHLLRAVYTDCSLLSSGNMRVTLLIIRSLNPLKTEFLLTNIYKSSSYLTGNTLRLRYKAQPVNAVWGNSRCLL
jgi:hypothetical protein